MSMYSDNEQVGSLGKMDLSKDEVTVLLGNGNITLRISMQ